MWLLRVRMSVAALALLVVAAPARAQTQTHDTEMARVLAGVLERAHEGDPRDLLRMMSEPERQRFQRESAWTFPLHLRRLGVFSLVTCARTERQGPVLPTSAGDLLPGHEHRCQVECQRGRYHVLLTLSAPDPLVRPLPRPGRVERLHVVSPLLDATPWPAFPPGSQLLWLSGTFALGGLLLLRGALRLGDRDGRDGRGNGRGKGRGPAPVQDEDPDEGPGGAGGSAPLWRSQHEVVLVVRLLSALSVLLLLPLWARIQPLPLWGRASIHLGTVGILLIAVGMAVSALAGYLRPRPRDGLQRAGALLSALATLGVTVYLSADSLGPGQQPVRWPQGRYRLPVPARAGEVYVRRGGTALDLVLLHPDGRSCQAPRLSACRTFGAEVVAPADGVVVMARGYLQDPPIGARDRDNPDGNFVLLRHGGEFLLLSHLQAGSVTVRPGQAVARGQVLGRAGNSGDSDEPHVEMTIWGAMQPLPARRPAPAGAPMDERAGLPVRIQGYVRHTLLGARHVEAGLPDAGDLISGDP
jgi:hypothetical protein